MAGSVNKVILVGNLGRDPEIRTMNNGSKVCNLNLATSESWKDRNTGERQDRTEWHRVVIFNKGLVDIAEKYLHKGSKVYLEGQLQTRKWTDNSGVEKYTTEVVLQNFRGELTLLGKPSAGQDNSEGNSEGNSGGFGDNSDNGTTRTTSNYGGGFGGTGTDNDLDDEIPF